MYVFFYHPIMINVLVVEDDEALREGIAAILEMEGYQVTAVASGHAAILAANPLTDLLLLDWQLPDINGDAVLRHIRQRFPHLPCILSSCQISAMQYADMFALTVFLHKPYDIDTFLQLIDSTATRKIV